MSEQKTHKCDHHCVIGNIFSKEYDQSFLEAFHEKQKQPTPSGKVVVYTAKNIITLDDLMPEAKAIAVQGNRIHSIGSLNSIETSLKAKGTKYEVNTQFQNNYFYPGFIESHCHASLEAVYHHFVYVGAYDRLNASGEIMPALTTNNDVVERLKESMGDKDILIAWGYDPSVLKKGETCLTAQGLNKVSDNKSVIVMNMSGHIAYANHFALNEMGYTNDCETVGVVKENGQLTGELQEFEAMGPILAKFELSQAKLSDGLIAFASVAQKKGITTATDLGLGLVPGAWKAMVNITNKASFPVKLSNYVFSHVYEQLGGSEAYFKAKELENSKLVISGVKIVSDGSIQGYTANMKWPYYYDKDEAGIKNISVEDGISLFEDLVKHDIQAAIHTNGNAAIEDMIACVSHVLRFAPDRDPRFRLEHCQTVSNEQLKQMKKYNILANFFINHLYYWGDFHKAHTLGPDKVKSMNPLASAKKLGVTFALHSDAPITAVDPLRMIQNAIERKSFTGVVLGQDEQITVRQALEAVTKDAAYLLKEEKDKGTLEVGKYADITILEDDIEHLPSEEIANTNILGTIVDGTLFVN
ncbi:amidohydrolase [Francisellaceae bacterium]|nr:amidohydrolase [Francisellaceae bacterium]